MRNGMKRAALGLAAAALSLGLMGCSLSSGFADYDVSGYFQALLDSSYKNQNENYATVAATTEENAQQNNTTTVRNAAVNFCNTYGVTPSDDQLSQLQEVMSQALAQASYTVQDEVKTETGYTLEIVIDPIVNFSDMDDDIRQLRNQAQDEATQANSSASDEEDSYGSGDSYDESSDGDSYDSYDDYGSDDYGYGGDSSEDSSTMEDQDSSLGVGEEPVEAVARARDARVLLLAADAAEGTRRRCEHFARAGGFGAGGRQLPVCGQGGGAVPRAAFQPALQRRDGDHHLGHPPDRGGGAAAGHQPAGHHRPHGAAIPKLKEGGGAVRPLL